MIAVDTNILVRLLVADDEAQFKRVKRIMAEHDVLVPVTVLLETEWVLRKSYGLGVAQVAGALRGVIQLERVHCEDAESLLIAIDGFEQGMDFADALHLAQSKDAERFVTFDRNFKKRARAVGSFIEVVTP